MYYIIHKIPLSTKGKYSGLYEAIIDEVDKDLLEFDWSVKIPRKNAKTVYAWRYENKKSVFLHRIILSQILERPLLPGEFCDHIDGNGLNCTRRNLRSATREQNGANQGKHRTNTSGYKGVHWDNKQKMWIAVIVRYGVSEYLGAFSDIELARDAYIKKAKIYDKEFVNYG